MVEGLPVREAAGIALKAEPRQNVHHLADHALHVGMGL
jgi:hypothetical protein